MQQVVKDISEVFAGQGSFSYQPFLSSKNIRYNDLIAILHNSPKSHSTDFIFQPKQLIFAFPYNHGKKWLREIKDILLLYSSEKGRMLYPDLYALSKGNKVKIQGKIFIKTQNADKFTQDELTEIACNILDNYIILPRKFCSLDICCQKNNDITVMIGQFNSPCVPGNGFWIYFNLACQISKIRTLKPLDFFSKTKTNSISVHGHYTSRRNGILLLLLHLFEYGNKIAEVSEYVIKNFNGEDYYIRNFWYYDIKSYISRDLLTHTIKQNTPNYLLNSPIIKHNKFGFGKIINRNIEKDDERIEVLFYNDSIVRTLVLKDEKKSLEFDYEKYSGQIFNHEVHILNGSPIYEYCIFKKGVIIKENASPLFISCSFYA